MICKPVSYYEARTRYDYENARDGSLIRAVPVTSYELVITEQVAHYDPKDVAATDLAGKPIDPKTLARHLQTETAVLIATMGNAVDPYYLTVVREGTLILVPRVTDAPVVPSSALRVIDPAPPAPPPG